MKIQLYITRPTYHVAGRKKITRQGRCKGCKLKLGETSARFLSLTDTSVARRVEPSRADPIHSNPSQSSPKMPARNSNFISSPVLRPPFPVMSCLMYFSRKQLSTYRFFFSLYLRLLQRVVSADPGRKRISIPLHSTKCGPHRRFDSSTVQRLTLTVAFGPRRPIPSNPHVSTMQRNMDDRL